jgi:hypothetical protein
MPGGQPPMAFRCEFEGDLLHPTGKDCGCDLGDKVVA